MIIGSKVVELVLWRILVCLELIVAGGDVGASTGILLKSVILLGLHIRNGVLILDLSRSRLCRLLAILFQKREGLVGGVLLWKS